MKRERTLARRVASARRRRRRNSLHASLPAMEWMEEASGACPRVIALGSRSLLVENCAGVASFSPGRVLLDTPAGPLCVTGSALTLCDMRPRCLRIRGRIEKVELPCQGEDER